MPTGVLTLFLQALVLVSQSTTMVQKRKKAIVSLAATISMIWDTSQDLGLSANLFIIM